MKSPVEPLAVTFICGCPRSGTSWTWGLMISLPGVEPLLIEDFPETRLPGFVCRMRDEEAGDFRTTETTIFFSELDDQAIRRGVESKASRHPGALLVEKTPDNIRKLDRIFAVFPEARVIRVTRDPRAVACSLMHTRLGDFRFARDLGDAIRINRETFEASRRFEDDERLMVVRYEDLHQRPVETLRKLAGFCGLEQLTDGDLEAAVSKNKGRVLARQPGIFRKGEPDSWREELGGEEIERIEADLADLMQHYGYRPARNLPW